MTPATTTTPRRVQTRLAPEVRRRQILDEATRLIAVSGFNAVSLAAIADACGIRQPSLLHYFSTKNELLASVLAQRDADAEGMAMAPDDERTASAVGSRLRNAVEQNLQMRELIRLYVVLGAEAMDPMHPAHDYFAERTRLALLALEDMLPFLPDPALAARELLAFWQGLESLWIAVPELDVLAVWDAHSERFFGAQSSAN